MLGRVVQMLYKYFVLAGLLATFSTKVNIRTINEKWNIFRKCILLNLQALT